MPDFGEQASFVWSAYGIVFGSLFLLILFAIGRYVVAKRQLTRLERQVAKFREAQADDA